MISFPFVLAFPELSLLRTHFRPFTEVMRKRRCEVTWKSRPTAERTEIADTIKNRAQSLLSRRSIFWHGCIVDGDLIKALWGR
jgi:ribosomal protein S8E